MIEVAPTAGLLRRKRHRQGDSLAVSKYINDNCFNNREGEIYFIRDMIMHQGAHTCAFRTESVAAKKPANAGKQSRYDRKENYASFLTQPVDA